MFSRIFNRKSNKFYFFVMSYASVFSLLAFFGTIEATRRHVEQERVTKETADQIAAITKNKALYRMPRMDVTMSALQGKSHHMRLGISLEIDQKNMDLFNDFQPRVSDRIVDFLDHQNIDAFEGPKGMYNLRHDILSEVNKASGPVVISDIIFREFVVR